jgi:hypothetical protein
MIARVAYVVRGFDSGVTSREKQTVVSAIEPVDHVRRRPVVVAKFGDHADPLVITDVRAFEDEPVAKVSVHGSPPITVGQTVASPIIVVANSGERAGSLRP